MNRFLQIVLILLLLIIAIFQVLAARGIFPHHVKQEVCPVEAITMVNGKAVIDTIKCIGCVRCVDGFMAMTQLEMSFPIPAEADSAHSPETATTLPAKQAEKTEGRISSESFSKEIAMVTRDTIPKQKAIPESVAVEIMNKDSEVKEQYYVVDRKICIACNMCLRKCPENAITYFAGKAYIDSLKCSNCGICTGLEPSIFRGCPVAAIHPNNL